jgi:hypothetical protein
MNGEWKPEIIHREFIESQRQEHKMKIGQPQSMLLSEFGDLIQKAFGTHSVYHVGSSLTRKEETWRDVDIRLMLTEEQWDKLGLLDPKQSHYDPKWRSLCIVFSHYGRHLTGLPIDFQIQRITEANEEFKGVRSWCGIINVSKEQPA